MVKCAEAGLEPRIRKLRSVLFLKANLVGKFMAYASYKSSGLALMVSELLYR